jgi:hypothetical protein
MQTIAQIFSSTTRATTPAEAGPRELQWSELTQVGGGLPKGGWAASGTALPDSGPLSVEPLPKGGWQQA